MPNQFIYVYSEGSYDQSRWLDITAPNSGDCTLHLQDLCHPGQVSHLLKVSCPLDFVQTSIEHGPLQLTTRNGYALLRKRGDLIDIEFRGENDASITRVSVLFEDVRARIESLAAEATARRAA